MEDGLSEHSHEMTESLFQKNEQKQQHKPSELWKKTFHT